MYPGLQKCDPVPRKDLGFRFRTLKDQSVTLTILS